MDFSINQNFNKIHSSRAVSFGAKRLFILNLKRLKPNAPDEYVPAYFTELTTKRDLEMLRKISPAWENASYWKKILLNFEDTLSMVTRKYRNKFFIIECPQLNDPNSRIRAIVEACPMKFEYGIVFLQSASVLKNLEELKGAGLAIIRGICKLASDLNVEQIGLLSSKRAEKWYEKIGFLREKDDLMPGFVLKRNDYVSFLDRHAQEYGELIPITE